MNINAWLEKNILRFNIVIGTLMTLSVFTYTYFNGKIDSNFRDTLTSASHFNSILAISASNYSQAHLNLSFLMGFNCQQCEQNCSQECTYRRNHYEELRKKIEAVDVEAINVGNTYNEALEQQIKVEAKSALFLKISSYSFFLMALLSIFANTFLINKKTRKN